MLFQLLVLAGLILFCINLSLNLALLTRPSKRTRFAQGAPLVSVLIPARNEEDNIGDCLRSVLGQDYPNLEVIVLDDNSRDGTSAAVRQIAAGDPRVRLIAGRVLPEGWVGKCFACHQLAEQASGEWLIFVDADTVSKPHMVGGTLQIAMKAGASMVSGLPQQKVGGMTQKIVVPILFYFLVVSWFPLWWLNRSRRPVPTLAIGQFLLFERGAYLKMGGHQAVRSRIMEDVWFGIEMARSGRRTLTLDLSGTISTKMYHNLGDMTEGCAKWFYSVAALSPLSLAGFVLAAYVFYLAPFYWLAATPPTVVAPFGIWWSPSMIIAYQVGIILVARLVVDLYFRGSAISFIFHPLGLAFLIMTVLYAVGRRALGAGVAWKDRVYSRISQIK